MNLFAKIVNGLKILTFLQSFILNVDKVLNLLIMSYFSDTLCVYYRHENVDYFIKKIKLLIFFYIVSNSNIVNLCYSVNMF